MTPGEPQEAPPEAAAAEGSGNEVVDLATNITNGMQMFLQVAGSSGAAPQAVEKAAQAAQMWAEALEEIVSGAGAPPGQPGEASMEAGGNPNARPLGPQG